MTKQDLRRAVAARKALLSAHERLEAARAVFDALERLTAFTLAENILLYHSLPDELPTHEFLDKWGKSRGKRFFLPRVNGVNLDILPYDSSRMALGAFHIEEPQGDDTVDMSEIDMVVVPGVAFDRSRNRLGRGKGFYDRLLAGSRAVTVGVAFDCQLFDADEIPVEPHDVALDYIITERRRLP